MLSVANTAFFTINRTQSDVQSVTVSYVVYVVKIVENTLEKLEL